MPPTPPATAPSPTDAAMRTAREIIREAKATDLPRDPTDEDVALLMARVIDRETGLPELIAALRSIAGTSPAASYCPGTVEGLSPCETCEEMRDAARAALAAAAPKGASRD